MSIYCFWSSEIFFSDSEEQLTATNRRCGLMTTFRRFCCNDLLRLGELDIDPENIAVFISSNSFPNFSSGEDLYNYFDFFVEFGMELTGNISHLCTYNLVFVSAPLALLFEPHGNMAGKLSCGFFTGRQTNCIQWVHFSFAPLPG